MGAPLPGTRVHRGSRARAASRRLHARCLPDSPGMSKRDKATSFHRLLHPPGEWRRRQPARVRVRAVGALGHVLGTAGRLRLHRQLLRDQQQHRTRLPGVLAAIARPVEVHLQHERVLRALGFLGAREPALALGFPRRDPALRWRPHVPRVQGRNGHRRATGLHDPGRPAPKPRLPAAGLHLENAPFLQTQTGFPDRPTSYTEYGRTYLFGVNYSSDKLSLAHAWAKPPTPACAGVFFIASARRESRTSAAWWRAIHAHNAGFRASPRPGRCGLASAWVGTTTPPRYHAENHANSFW